MTDFKGSKYKLAGFSLHQKSGLVEVFAKFCGISDDTSKDVALSINAIVSAELSAAQAALTTARTLADVPLLELPSGPIVSVDDVVILLGAKSQNADNGNMHMLRLPGPQKEDLLQDLGAEKLGLLLVEMGKARANYIAGAEIFIPLAKLNKI